MNVGDPRAYENYLEHIVWGLVENPAEVVVTKSVDEQGVLLALSVAPEDMGKVIGREGNTAKAIRSLLRAYGMKNGARISLRVNEPEGRIGADDGTNDL